MKRKMKNALALVLAMILVFAQITPVWAVYAESDPQRNDGQSYIVDEYPYEDDIVYIITFGDADEYENDDDAGEYKKYYDTDECDEYYRYYGGDEKNEYEPYCDGETKNDGEYENVYYDKTDEDELLYEDEIYYYNDITDEDGYDEIIDNLYIEPLFVPLSTPAQWGTVTFSNVPAEMVVRAGTISPLVNIQIEIELNPFTGLSPLAPVRLDWWHNGTIRSVDHFSNLQDMGINPEYDHNNTGELTGSLMPGTLPIWNIATVADSGEYVLRVYIAGQYMASSTPIQVNVVDFAGNLTDAVVEFIYPNPQREFLVYEGDVHNLINDLLSLEVEITLPPNIGLTTDDTIFTRWVCVDRGEQASIGSTSWLNIWSFDPDYPDAFTFRMSSDALWSWVAMSFERTGYYILQVYIAGVMVGESNPVLLIVQPAPPVDLSSISVDFTTFFDSLNVVPGDSIRDFKPFNVSINLGSVSTRLRNSSSITLRWVNQNGNIGFGFGTSSLGNIGIDPADASRLIPEIWAIESMGRFPGFNPVSAWVHGTWHLHVYIAGQLVGTSPPVTINVAGVPNPPATPVIYLNPEGTEISWEPVPDASEYIIFSDRMSHGFTISMPLLDMQTARMWLVPGTHIIEVQSRRRFQLPGNDWYESVLSERSNAVIFYIPGPPPPPAAPVITIEADGFTLSWDRVVGFTSWSGYSVDVVGHSGGWFWNMVPEFDGNRYSLDLRPALRLSPGNHIIQLRAFNATYYGQSMSEPSNSVIFTQQPHIGGQLTTPTNLTIIGAYLTWDAIDNAIGHVIHIWCSYSERMIGSRMMMGLIERASSLLDIFHWYPGEHRLYVIAIGDWI